MRQTAQQRRARAELDTARAEDQDGDFLREWLQLSAEGLAGFKVWSTQIDADERSRVAHREGFRTWSGYVKCCADIHRALGYFVEHETFTEVWARLRTDPGADAYPWGFSSTNAGVPRRLLSAIATWHRTPKFTKAEWAGHLTKIAAKSRELVALLEQVTPGGLADSFSVLHITRDQAQLLFKSFATPAKRLAQIQKYDKSLALTGRHYLQRAGIDPLGALKLMERAALDRQTAYLLPRKVRSASAFRTFMTVQFADSLLMFSEPRALKITDQLIADAVALLTDSDCTRNDVRAALAPLRNEIEAARAERFRS